MAADVAAGEPDFPQDLTTTTRAARRCAKPFALIGKAFAETVLEMSGNTGPR
jgi:hypothetical protein